MPHDHIGADMLTYAAKTIKQRGEVYGPMPVNMQRTADLWSVLLSRKVTAGEVAMCLIAVKLARLVQSPDHVDSAVDIAGYAAALRECQVAEVLADAE